MTIQVSEVSCAFGERMVLQTFTATFLAGRITALTGPSGSGKTTLLNMLGGLTTPDSGTIEFKGLDIASMNSGARRKYRRANVGYLFQDYGLVPDLSVLENIKIAWGVMILVDGETHRSGRIKSCHVSIRISFVSSALMRC